MTAVAQVAAQVTEMRSTAAGILLAIREASSAEAATGLRDKVRMAREWAKIQKVAREVHLDLLRAEIYCLRRIAQLDALSVLSTADRAAAKFWGGQSDEGIEQLLAAFGRYTTATGVYRMHQQDERDRSSRQIGREFARGEAEYEEPDEHFDYRVREQARDHRAALAAMLDDYASTNRAFSVDEMVQEFIEDYGIDRFAAGGDDAIRQGIAEVCREAIRKAPAIVVNGTHAPKFITCIEPHSENFHRIPFANATVGQLAEMVALREEQLRQDQAAFDRLAHVLANIRSLPGVKDSTVMGGVVQNWMIEADDKEPVDWGQVTRGRRSA